MVIPRVRPVVLTVWQSPNFSDLEQDLEETTAEDSRRGKDMQVYI